jgi:hypothetical protein
LAKVFIKQRKLSRSFSYIRHPHIFQPSHTVKFSDKFICLTPNVCQIFDVYTCIIISVYPSPIILHVFGSVSPTGTININVNNVKHITQYWRNRHWSRHKFRRRNVYLWLTKVNWATLFHNLLYHDRTECKSTVYISRNAVPILFRVGRFSEEESCRRVGQSCQAWKREWIPVTELLKHHGTDTADTGTTSTADLGPCFPKCFPQINHHDYFSHSEETPPT